MTADSILFYMHINCTLPRKKFIRMFTEQLDYELEISEVILNDGDTRVNYRFIEIQRKQSNCFSENEFVFVVSSKLFQKTRNKYCFLAKNSASSRYSPLLDIYWRIDSE